MLKILQNLSVSAVGYIISNVGYKEITLFRPNEMTILIELLSSWPLNSVMKN